jgi:hypothetical protein
MSIFGEVGPILSIKKLIPFRHKYAAHRDRDKPLRDETNSLSGELALGALGGRAFRERGDGSFKHIHGEIQSWESVERRLYKDGYVVFQIQEAGNLHEFTPELDHPLIIDEIVGRLDKLIQIAQEMPK